ncbi:MAG: MoxR family ATPase [Cytophagales bacterium]|nr:MAG: MoxR family ATPase [Cytophagales bacterium]
MFENRIDLTTFKQTTEALKTEMQKIIIGQTETIDLLWIALLSNGHVLMEGVPGVAKTLIAKLFASLMQASFARIQFTPDLMPTDVSGTSIFNNKDATFDFRKGPIFANIVLIDEINRAPAKTQAALFEVMEERQLTYDGTTYPLEPPFMVLATQNPIEQEGTYRLPEAQLDRFLFKIKVNYPNLEEEYQILQTHQHRDQKAMLPTLQPIVAKEQIAQIKQQINQIHIEETLLKYIAQVIIHTRQHPALYLGASPRASLAIMHAAKVYAAMNGRDFVTPEDCKYVAVPVLNHRVQLTPEKEMEGITVENIIEQILKNVEIPR